MAWGDAGKQFSGVTGLRCWYRGEAVEQGRGADMVTLKQEVALRDWRHLVATDVAAPVPEGSYGYEAALWAAGVKVLAFREFGSYQGEWWAKVEFPSGQIGWVSGEYGSCSGCDAFEGEFGYADSDTPNYLHRLRDFGREYLSNVSTFEQAVASASENLSWDHDAEEMVAWIQEQGPSPTCGGIE